MQNQATYYTNISAKIPPIWYDYAMDDTNLLKVVMIIGSGLMAWRKIEAWSGDAGNQLDFGDRIYDRKLGRFLSN
ncbi:MAG: hypothetical protein R2777_04190 [Chitinophagales bacterium]